MLGKNAPSALPCYVPPVTHYLILGTIGAAVFLIPLSLCAFRYRTAECVKSLFVRGMIGKNAPSALPCYVPPVTHYLILCTIGAAVFLIPLSLWAFRYRTAECVKSLFVRGMIGKNAPSALPCYVLSLIHI